MGLKNDEKVIVALSGGVDSSYAAWLLQRQGYEVEGLCLDLFENSNAPAEAAEAGRKLGIKVHIAEKHRLFRRRVVDYFCRTYRAGQTPNPCAVCNPEVKFAALLHAADEWGAGKVATGHYARCHLDPDTGQYLLLRGKDLKKDQSYFLYRLGQDVLRRALFPLGELSKEEVRAGAAEAGLSSAAKRDSQEICFIPDGDYPGFLRQYIPAANTAGEATAPGREGISFLPGDIVDREGAVLGRHKGIACYTVGQRKSLGLSLGNAAYVLAIDPVHNQIVAGPENALYTKEARTASDSFIRGAAPNKALAVTVKLRAGALPAAAIYHPPSGVEEGGGEGLLLFEEAQRAVTPGQCAVYYLGDEVLGGGVIIK